MEAMGVTSSIVVLAAAAIPTTEVAFLTPWEDSL